MCEQSADSVTALRDILREFVTWVWQQTVSERWLHAGQREVCFDDTQLEVCDKHFEGAAINYNDDLARNWQTRWVGPWLCDSTWAVPSR